MSEPKTFQQWDAGHDVNGNPRRAWVVWDENGAFYDAIDEGYAGRPGVLRELNDLGRVKVKVAEYREILKRSPSNGRFFKRAERSTGDCSVDCLDACVYPGQFSECDLDPEI